MCRPIYIALFFLLSSVLTAQTLSKQDKRKADRMVREAQGYLDADDYYNALQFYKEALKANPRHETAGTNAAICMQKLAYPADSSVFLLENLTLSKQVDANYYLALIKHLQRKFEESILLLQTYRKVSPSKRLNSNTEVDYRIQINRNAIDFLSNPNEALIKNIGSAVNSKYHDYVPIINLEENLLYFTSKRDGGTSNKLNSDNSFFEDVYVSKKVNGSWQKAVNIGPPINSETNDACVALSYDGQKMMVYRTAKDQISGDLYMSTLNKNNTWDSLVLLNKEINSDYVETSACFSNDSSEIFFSSNRPGGFGGKDIYRIKRLPNMEWSWAYNLGPAINTAYDEDAPYLHPDARTFYFSSKGHSSMGGYDVFSSQYNIEENEFSDVQNLGHPINDIKNDIFFILSMDAQRAYYSSERPDSYGGTDIYQIDTRYKPRELAVVNGKALLDSLPVKAKISLFEQPGNVLQGTYSSNSATGNFILVVNPYKRYQMLIEAEGCEDQKIDMDAIVMVEGTAEMLLVLKKIK